jgi:predicted secreted protein
METRLSRRSLTLAIGLATMIVTAGCSSSNTEVRLTEQDNGRTIALKRGQLLSVTLRPPVLPWRWEVDQSPEGIVKHSVDEENRRASPPPKDAVPGRLSDTTFVFEGIAAGRTTLTFVIRRPDRKDEETKEDVKIQVNVE